MSMLNHHLEPLQDGSYEICQNDTDSFYYVFAAFVLALIGLYFYKFSYLYVGYFFLFLFALSAGWALKLVLIKKILLIVTSNYITYIHPISGTSENILMDDIIEFREVRVKREKFIAIMVSNGKEVVETQTNPLTQKLMRLAYKMHGTPFLVPTNRMSAHQKEVVALLRDTLTTHNTTEMI